ncbi:MAG: phosphatase PAP2 family protein, partial [Bacteroidota bacterium]
QKPVAIATLPGAPTAAESYDARLVRSIYAIDAPAFVHTMEGVHVGSVPLFIATPLAAWGGTLVAGSDPEPALALSAAWVGTFGTIALLKNTIRRPRPFLVLDGIEQRGSGPTDVIDRYSFPSGHAGLSFTIATSLSLSYPAWYVIAPAYLWATATALSRVWHGVHYPSDIVVGAVLGSGIALGMHALVEAFVDEGDDASAAMPRPPLVSLTIPLR